MSNNVIPGSEKIFLAGEERQRIKRKSNQNFWQASFGRFFKSKVNIIALTVFLIIGALSAGATLISDNILHTNPEYFRASFSPAYAAPGTPETLRNGQMVIHWLGTDDLGRDTLARLLHGGGASLSIAILVTIIILAIGVPIGLLAGFFGGKIDDICNALIQVINNIPFLYLLIVLGGIFRPNIIFLSIVFGVLSWTGTARQVRGLTFSLRQRDFIAASTVMGSSYLRLMAVHIIPNIMSIILVLIGTDIAVAMLGEAALSYLGFGIRDPDVSWGKLLSNSSQYLTYRGNHNPFLILGPGIMIFLTVLSVYLIADGFRDAFDPTLRR